MRFFVLLFYLRIDQGADSEGIFALRSIENRHYVIIVYVKVLFISPTRMRASTLNFFNPPDTKLRKLKVEGVISAREMNKNYNG